MIKGTRKLGTKVVQPLSQGKPQNQQFMPTQYTKANQVTIEDTEVKSEDDSIKEVYTSGEHNFYESILDDFADDDTVTVKSNMIRKTPMNVSDPKWKDINIKFEYVRMCNNLNVGQDNTHVMICDNGADTSVIGKGWHIAYKHQTRKANVVGFDEKCAFKSKLDIVTALAVVEPPGGYKFFVEISEAVHNPTAEHSLLSELQFRSYGVTIDSVAKAHGGKQYISAKGKVIPLRIQNCLMTFKYRQPTEDELTFISKNEGHVLKLTEGSEPWDPKKYCDDSSEEYNTILKHAISNGIGEEMHEVNQIVTKKTLRCLLDRKE